MSLKPSILFIMHMPPPVHGAAMMGKYIHDSELINKTFDCHYINLTTAKNLKDIGKGGIGKFWKFICLLIEVVKEIRKRKPQLVYVTPNSCGGAFYKDFIVVQLLKNLEQEVVIHFHNKGVSTRQERTLDNLLYKLFFKEQNVIQLADALYPDIQKYVSLENVYVCPNGIPINKGIEKKKTVHKEPQILFLSNMMEAKGVWDLVDACKLLKEQGKVFTCHFVGKWSDISQEAFDEKVQEDELGDYIEAHGAKYGEEKNEFFQETDIFVFPTYYENESFPLVLLEAMEYSLPCISTNEGGISAIIENKKTGYIVERQSPQVLAKKIAFLLEHPQIRKEMGKAGREKFLKEFTLEIFENRMKDILKECITFS